MSDEPGPVYETSELPNVTEVLFGYVKQMMRLGACPKCAKPRIEQIVVTFDIHRRRIEERRFGSCGCQRPASPRDGVYREEVLVLFYDALDIRALRLFLEDHERLWTAIQEMIDSYQERCAASYEDKSQRF